MVAGSYSNDLWAFDTARPCEGWRGADAVSGDPPPPRGWMQVNLTGNCPCSLGWQAQQGPHRLLSRCGLQTDVRRADEHRA